MKDAAKKGPLAPLFGAEFARVITGGVGSEEDFLPPSAASNASIGRGEGDRVQDVWRRVPF
jgi:hypothetical protein